MTKKLTTKQFIEKARKKHNNYFTYEKVDYKTTRTAVIITCPIHGDFSQPPHSHLLGRNGCKICVEKEKRKRKNYIMKKRFIKKCKEKYNNFNYEKTNYTHNRHKVIITCMIHGDFKILPHGFLRYGCAKCNIINKQKNYQNNFIVRANKTHNNFYAYTYVDYKAVREKVIITCPIHGNFEQTPESHLRGEGCKACGIKKCGENQIKKNSKEYINKCIMKHGNTYIYDKTNYVGCKNHVVITCRIHGDFEQLSTVHLRGSGCPHCANNNYSKSQIEWLNYRMIVDNCNIRHAMNNNFDEKGEEKILNYKVDGFCKETQIVYEFHGDFWHGNPQIYNPFDNNRVNNKNFWELYQDTMKKKHAIINAGYHYICIWEREWTYTKKCVKIIQKWWRRIVTQ